MICLNCLRTSITIDCAALPTESIVSAANTNGKQAPMNNPTRTTGFIMLKLSTTSPPDCAATDLILSI